MLTFEQAEALLTPQQRSEMARVVLEDAALLPKEMSEAQRVFCMGLEAYCEYECRADVTKYLL